MNFAGKAAIPLAIGLALNLCAFAEDGTVSDNPYSAISVRNIFDLRPPEVATTTEPQVSVKITPNGIMSIFGRLQVLFKTTGSGPGNKEQSYILSEGQRQDDIEVLQIDDKKGTIKFNNHGVVQDLALANAKPSSSTAPSGSPTASGFPMPNIGNAGFAARGPGRFGNFGGGRNRTDNPEASSGSNPTSLDTSNLRNVPTRNPAGNEPSTMTPEEQVIMIEAQREYYKAQGNPIYNILPPTPASGGGGPTGPGGPAAP